MKLYGCNLYLCDSCGGTKNTRTYVLGSKGTACKCERLFTVCDSCRQELVELLKDESSVRFYGFGQGEK